MILAYNNNKYTSYFRYKNTDFTKIYICKNKTNTVDYIDDFCQEIETQYNTKIRVIHMDKEISTGPRFDIIRKKKSFIIKITALANSAQNNNNKRSGKKFIIKSYYNRIEARFPVDI
jgi:hypothetical protein